MDCFPFQTVIKTSEQELLQYGIIDWSHVALLAQRNVIWKCRAVTVRVHQEFVFDRCVALEGSEQQSNYSQQSIRLPPWQLWQWLHFFATSSHGTVLKQRPTMTFYEFTVYMLLAQEYHCTAQQQYTLAAHLNLASEFLKHMYCRGIRYDAVSNGFNSSMSFEGKNNPVGSPLKIDVALWSCQSNHVRCDRVSARVSTHPKVRKCELGLMQRLGSRVISARSHGHPLVQTTTFSEKFRYVETQICWIDIGLTHTHNWDTTIEDALDQWHRSSPLFLLSTVGTSLPTAALLLHEVKCRISVTSV